MTEIDQLRQMQSLTKAQYERAQQSFQEIVAEETALRLELTRIDQMDRGTRGQPHDDIWIRAIGADLIWAEWVGRKRTQLNMQLARVLARKAPHMAIVKKAYGEAMVVSELLDERCRTKNHKAQNVVLSEIINQSVINSY